MKKEKWKWKSLYTYSILLVLALIAIIGWIFLKTKYNAHSDWATAPLLAREELRHGSLFPEGWVYAQGVWLFSLQVLVLPFLAVTKNMLLSRELAVVLQTLLVTFLFVKGLSKMTTKKGAVLAAIFMLIPISWEVLQNHYYEATYNTNNIWLMLLLFDMICFHESVKRKSRWAVFQGVVLAVLVTILTIPGTKLLATMFLPFLAGLVLYLAIKEKFYIKKMIKHTSALWIIGCTVLGMGIGLLCQKPLQNAVLYESGVASMEFTQGSSYIHNLGAMVYDYLELYGCVGTAEENIIGLGGIVCLFKWVVAFFMCLVVPIWCIVKYKKLKTDYHRVFVLFAWVSVAMMLFLCVVTPNFSNTPRYLLGVFVNNLILTIFFFDYYIEKSEYYSHLVLICLLLPLIGGSYLTSLKKDRGNYENYMAICEYLQEQGISYGYATYWNAQVMTVLSNGEAEIVPVLIGNPTRSFDWLSSMEWFEDSYYDGSFCLILAEGEGTPSMYEEMADEQVEIGNYRILIYRGNLSDYGDMFADSGLPFPGTCRAILAKDTEAGRNLAVNDEARP